VKTPAVHLAVVLSLYRSEALDEAWLLVPLAYSALDSVAFFAVQLHEQLVGQRHGPGGGGDRSLKRSLLLLPTDYGVLCLSFSLLWSAEVFMAAYAALFALNGAHVAYLMRTQLAAVRALDRRSGRMEPSTAPGSGGGPAGALPPTEGRVPREPATPPG
jgi:hypothetical protein